MCPVSTYWGRLEMFWSQMNAFWLVQTYKGSIHPYDSVEHCLLWRLNSMFTRMEWQPWRVCPCCWKHTSLGSQLKPGASLIKAYSYIASMEHEAKLGGAMISPSYQEKKSEENLSFQQWENIIKSLRTYQPMGDKTQVLPAKQMHKQPTIGTKMQWPQCQPSDAKQQQKPSKPTKALWSLGKAQPHLEKHLRQSVFRGESDHDFIMHINCHRKCNNLIADITHFNTFFLDIVKMSFFRSDTH